jgi:hypothetical protein
MSADHFVQALSMLKRKLTHPLAGRAGLRGGELLLPSENLNPLALSTCSVWLKKLLSLITFFAAAKKVIPPPGRRLLHKPPNKEKQHLKKT